MMSRDINEIFKIQSERNEQLRIEARCTEVMNIEQMHFMLLYFRYFINGKLDGVNKIHKSDLFLIVDKFNDVLVRIVDTSKINTLKDKLNLLPDDTFNLAKGKYENKAEVINIIYKVLDEVHNLINEIFANRLYKFFVKLHGLLSNQICARGIASLLHMGSCRESTNQLLFVFNALLSLDYDTKHLQHKSVLRNQRKNLSYIKQSELIARIGNLKDFFNDFYIDREYWIEGYRDEDGYHEERFYFDDYVSGYDVDDDPESDGVHCELTSDGILRMEKLTKSKRDFFYEMVKLDFEFCQSKGYNAFKQETFDDFVANYYDKNKSYDLSRCYSGRYVVNELRYFFGEHFRENIEDGDLSEIKWLKNFIKY